MTGVLPRGDAKADISAINAHYRTEAGPGTAGRFRTATAQAMALIKQNPGIGSPRIGHLLNMADLRVWPITGFPYLIFYIHEHGQVDVLRILHSARDIPASLRD